MARSSLISRLCLIALLRRSISWLPQRFKDSNWIYLWVYRLASICLSLLKPFLIGKCKQISQATLLSSALYEQGANRVLFLDMPMVVPNKGCLKLQTLPIKSSILGLKLSLMHLISFENWKVPQCGTRTDVPELVSLYKKHGVHVDRSKVTVKEVREARESIEGRGG